MSDALLPYYTPPSSSDQLQTLPVWRFMRFVERLYNCKIDSYADLHKWSCEFSSNFWEAVLKFCGVLLHKRYTKVVEDVPFDQIPKWFIGSRLNYAENLLDANGTKESSSHVAVIDAKSATEFCSFSYKTLRNDVLRLASSLRSSGVKVGTYVVGFLSNSYETAVAMLASAAIGAVWSSASVDFGTLGILDRFTQLNPTVLFAVINNSYKGKTFTLEEKIYAIVKGLPSLRKVILINPLKRDISTILHSDERLIAFDELMRSSETPSNFEYASVPFNHPLFIMFSSGTTGPPKGMVHTVGGTLLKHVEEHILQTGFNHNDKILFYTTCGWMMWNWLMSCFFVGMTVVLFDESPLEPDRHVLLKVAARHKCTVIGMGAKIYEEYEKVGGCPADIYDLSSIRMVLSTASPLSASCFRFINEKISRQAIIGSISGGTDIIGCFMGASELLPVVESECQCFYLGMEMASFSTKGESAMDEKGELVCLRPFPSMPSHFIHDADGGKYRRAYFERFRGVWAHGDFCCINSLTGGIVMLGRSDATLNKGGVRIGTAEIYSAVQTFEEIADCIVASQKINGCADEKIVLFVKMADHFTLSDSLRMRIKQQVRSLMSPRHVPDYIWAVPEIPYTISGKKVELAVKHILNGEKVPKLSFLRNPEALSYFLPPKEAT